MTIEDRSFRYSYLKQIRKNKARKLFYDEISIFILPDVLNHLSYHNQLKEIKCSYNIDFDELIKFERKDKFNNKHGYLKYYYISDNPKQMPKICFP
jgi:hypothetical protein